jgi:polysaccharide export outer membrane protein
VIINKSLSFVCLLALSACGAIYTSPSVIGASENIRVVEISPQSITHANTTPYVPKQLPDAFNQTSLSIQEMPIDTFPYLENKRNKNFQINLPMNAKPNPYKLGVSDVVLVATPTTESTTTLSALLAAQNKHLGYTVQDDGAISIPDIGRIVIAGQTLEKAEATIFQALVENQIDPKFALEIIEFNARSISVDGSVKFPKTVPITMKPLTLQNALQNAGGIVSLTPEYTTIQILRNNKEYAIPLQQFQGQPTLQNFILQDGDSINVENSFHKQIAINDANSAAIMNAQIKTDLKRQQSEVARKTFLTKLELGAVKRDYVYLAGEVAKQGRFPLPFNNMASVADAIYSKNGIRTREGNLSQIYVLRGASSNTSIIAYHLDAKNAVNLLLATKMQLRPNDIVFVAEQHVTAWNRVISQILPTFNVANLTDLIAQ